MLAELKSKLRETVTDPAWGDTRLLAWLAEGQDEFCEQTGFFVDNSTLSITLVAGTASYAIPDRVIQIYDIFDGTRKLGKFQEADRPAASSDWNPSTDPTTNNTPTAWQTDRETGYITFDNTPTAADDGDVYNIRAWRYSAEDLDDTDVEPEIPRRFHWAPIEWACYCALSGDHDMEKDDPVKGAAHLQKFNILARKGKRYMRRFHGINTSITPNPVYVA